MNNKSIRSLVIAIFCLCVLSPALATTANLVGNNSNASNPGKVIIAAYPSMAASTQTTAKGKAANTTMVNINRANLDQLQTLKGIGSKKAQAILDYRSKNGSFKNVDDLANVKGIGKVTVDKLRNRLTIR